MTATEFFACCLLGLALCALLFFGFAISPSTDASLLFTP